MPSSSPVNTVPGVSDVGASTNSTVTRDGNADSGFRVVTTTALGGVSNLGYGRGGVYSFAGTITIDNSATNGTAYLGTTGSSNYTVNLPASVSWAGQELEIFKVDSGTGTVIIDGNAAETINGSTTITLRTQYEGVRIRCDGTNWQVISYFAGLFAPGSITTAITDPGNAGAIPVTRSGYVSITSTGSDTRTLAIPTFVGQQLLLIHAVDGGQVAITAASAINIAGNTIMTATAVRAWILLTGSLTGVTKVWTVTATDGFTLS